jgi:hypothetical protein
MGQKEKRCHRDTEKEIRFSLCLCGNIYDFFATAGSGGGDSKLKRRTALVGVSVILHFFRDSPRRAPAEEILD